MKHQRSKTAIEIKQVLDLDDPVSKALLVLSLLNIALILATTRLDAAAAQSVIMQLVNTLFVLYVLSCFRNGSCNVFAFVTGMLLVAFTLMEIAMRVSV